MVRPDRTSDRGVSAHPASWRLDASEHVRARYAEGTRVRAGGLRSVATHASICRHARTGRRVGARRLHGCRHGRTTNSPSYTGFLASVPGSVPQRRIERPRSTAARLDGKTALQRCRGAIRDASPTRWRASRERGAGVRSCLGAGVGAGGSGRGNSSVGLVDRTRIPALTSAHENQPVSMGSRVARAKGPAVALAALC